MNSILMLAATTGNPVADIAHQFGVTWQLLISQIILFVIVAVAMKKFAFGPLLAMLDERKARIAESMGNAETNRERRGARASPAPSLCGERARPGS